MKFKVQWLEYATNGILRGIKNRIGWDKNWYQVMSENPIINTFSKSNLVFIKHPFSIPEDLMNKLSVYSESFQPAGESKAWLYLKTFLEYRGNQYHLLISKPTESRKTCSRISPYLAWGNLSIQQVVFFTKEHPNVFDHKRAYEAFLTRIKWHCHFIQKFEVECDYETLCVNRGYELLTYENNSEFIKAWKIGKTGYPMIDACMRVVIETGWINFRMRAMLVSFLCYHLDCDWREGVYHLAKQFLDYEPGIHYPQFQMQAGTTGVNTIRMYNPVKQSQDHDANGVFIKKWVPELVNVPIEFIHEPWKMTLFDQEFCGVRLGEDYPYPLVDLRISGKNAREKIWGHRNNAIVKSEKKRILSTHVRPR